MKKIRAPKILLVLILAISLCIPYSVHAISQDKPAQNHSFMLERLIDFLNFVGDLNLTEEQKTTLKDLTSATRYTIKPLMNEIKELRAEMYDTILANDIDPVKATDLNKKMLEVKSQIATIILNTKLEGIKVLTSEQRSMILEKKKAHDKRMEEWRDGFQELRDSFSKLLFN